MTPYFVLKRHKMEKREIIILFVFCFGVLIGEANTDPAQQALEYVFTIDGANCGAGTGEVLNLQFDVTAWNQYTDPAIRTANLLSKILALNKGTLDALTEEMFFLLVRNNVHGDSLIFGSAIAIENGVYSKYDEFCPYAYKKNNTVRSHDISINYDYLAVTTEWYNTLKIKPWNDVTMVADGIMYRNNNYSLPEVTEEFPIAELPDGHWTNPYFDCGGGDIWMVTYSSPIFNITINGTVAFMGVATIDIEMTYIDINQCDADGAQTSSGLDVFRGTHICQQTTTCVPVTGQGFTPGAYQCKCENGYYFPDLSSQIRAYLGVDIEQQNRKPEGVVPGMFRCVQCKEGCDTCVDDSPCLHERSSGLVYTLMALNAITIIMIVVTASLIHWKREERPIKSASPIFLKFMCTGGICMCIEFFLHVVDASIYVCSARIWFIHLGFFVMYGSIILKTWRISQIFTVGTKKKINLPDSVLLQRLGIITLVSIMILAAWNGSQPPTVSTLKTSDDLKFFICDYGPWEYAILGVQILFLLYGVYLCFTVRKAPAQFNESKHITWSVYNAIILGSFMKILARAFIAVVGPDMLLLFQFITIQVFVTITMLLLFVPKYLAIRNNVQVGPESTIGTVGTLRSVSIRAKKPQAIPRQEDAKEYDEKATQTDDKCV